MRRSLTTFDLREAQAQHAWPPPHLGGLRLAGDGLVACVMDVFCSGDPA